MCCKRRLSNIAMILVDTRPTVQVSVEGRGAICTATWPAVCCRADKAAYAAGIPALGAAVAGALCTAVDHLAAPRHMRLFIHLSLIAHYTWLGAHILKSSQSSTLESPLRGCAALGHCFWLAVLGQQSPLADIARSTDAGANEHAYLPCRRPFCDRRHPAVGSGTFAAAGHVLDQRSSAVADNWQHGSGAAIRGDPP